MVVSDGTRTRLGFWRPVDNKHACTRDRSFVGVAASSALSTV